jgi:hypothetical protein
LAFFKEQLAMKPLSPFKQSFLGTLLALALVLALGAAGLALAQEYLPNRDVNADGVIDTLDIQQVASSWNTSGSPRGTLTVFTSSSTTNGAAADGRAGMGALCRVNDPDAHFCTLEEINNAFGSTGVVFVTPFPMAWVDMIRHRNIARPNGADTYSTGNYYWRGVESSADPFYIQNCNGWTNANGASYGTIIMLNAENYTQVTCNQPLPVACCK